ELLGDRHRSAHVFVDSRAPAIGQQGVDSLVMQWNPGGLSQSSFLELKYWLRQQPIDIVVLSETKWSFNSCWSDDQWSYVHSASNDPRSGGVLIMIARRLATPDSIGFLALEDGRILHARIHHAKRATDILAVYQHVDYKTTQSRKLRAHLWAKLSDYVGQLPQRNQFICSGDFNTALPGVAPWTGTGHFHWQGSRTCGSQHEALTTAVDQAVEEPVDPSTDPEQIITHFFGHGITGADIALHSEPTRKKPDRLGPGKIADQYTAHSLTVAYVRTTWQGPSSLPHFSDEAPGGRMCYLQNQAHLLLPRRTGEATALPLKTMGRYLGVIVSYHAFEQQTWLHRKKTVHHSMPDVPIDGDALMTTPQAPAASSQAAPADPVISGNRAERNSVSCAKPDAMTFRVRQMAMIFYTSETEMFIPQQYNEQTLRLTHRALENHARFQMLLNVVLDRDFSHLWHTQQLNVLNNCRSILPRTAPSSSKLPLCCSHSMDDQLMLDQSDTELLQSFQHLGPLLMQASQYMREKDEEPLNKKLKQEPVGADKAAQPHNPQNKALLTLIHHLAKVVLQHDRAIQMDRRQDSFVIFAQVSAEGALPLLTSKAKEWKDMTEKTTTLRTFLLKHLILELQQRAIKLSQSTQGTQLWDVAVTKGVILQDGSWPFQQWCHTEKKLTKSHRAPLPMSRILKDLQFIVELLTDNDHVMRFHSLRPQANVVPWMLQINLREDDLWRLFHQLSQSTLWGLLGLSLKQHNQQVSKPAQLLDQLTNMQGTPNKGLSRDTFTLTDWGRQHDLFRDLLLELRPQPFNLDAQLWFQGITQNWDENRGQADSAEFTSMLLQWVAPSFLSCHWQRRLMENECVRVHDQGDRYQPPTLQLDPSHSTDGIARLTDMLRRWHNDLGMYAGLLQAPEVLCVHVDRFIYEGHGRVRKTDTPVFFGGPIDVPVFTDDGLDCTWERYQMTAAFAHQGDAATGHYQALLRTQPSIRHPDADTYWLHCDDDRPPRPCRMLPHQFQEGVTCIWLCRQDLIDLHAWEEDLLTTPPGHAQNQDQLLKLLQQP
ncbi:unnamed protein product, partial [Cladocopium goreaui]